MKSRAVQILLFSATALALVASNDETYPTLEEPSTSSIEPAKREVDIAEPFVLECSDINLGGIAAVNPNVVTPGVCYDRLRPTPQWDNKTIDTAAPFSIGLGEQLACDFHSDYGCKGTGVLKWFRWEHPILRDTKHPMWKEYGFRADGSGPWSWSCAVVVE